MSTEIATHRRKIDELDAQILDLIQQRVTEAILIRQLKQAENIPLFTPEREQSLIQKLIEKSSGRLAPQVVKDIWQTIILGGKQTTSI